MQWKLFFAVHRFQTGSIRPVFGRELRLQPSEISMALMHCDGKIRRNWRKKLEVYIYISFAVYVCRIYFFSMVKLFHFQLCGTKEKGWEIWRFWKYWVLKCIQRNHRLRTHVNRSMIFYMLLLIPYIKVQMYLMFIWKWKSNC